MDLTLPEVAGKDPHLHLSFTFNLVTSPFLDTMDFGDQTTDVARLIPTRSEPSMTCGQLCPHLLIFADFYSGSWRTIQQPMKPASFHLQSTGHSLATNLRVPTNRSPSSSSSCPSKSEKSSTATCGTRISASSIYGGHGTATTRSCSDLTASCSVATQ